MSNPCDESSDKRTLGFEGLVQQGIITPQALEFLKACLMARLNLAISGPSTSGKRNLLQTLVSFFRDDEQIIAIQNPDEPSLIGKGITTLRANLSLSQGKGIITRHYLLTLVPRMHPQRLILDRVQGSEALSLLRLLLTMDGVMFSIVADSPQDVLSNLEGMLLLCEARPNMTTMRRILSSSLDLIIQLRRSQDGSAKIVNLTEVPAVEDDTIILRDIFLYREGKEKQEKSPGLLQPTGIKPQFIDRIEALSISLPTEMFLAP